MSDGGSEPTRPSARTSQGVLPPARDRAVSHPAAGLALRSIHATLPIRMHVFRRNARQACRRQTFSMIVVIA